MALHVMDEANHCLGCKKPRCQQGCPIHTNIPEVIRLLKENKLDDAGRMLFENNPLTTVCSLVCNHENQCEGHCVQGIKGAPVHFSVIENYISSTYASQMTKGPATPNGKKAAIIGSGPAGLTIAVILARYGYDVTIFESHDKIGGVLRYGIPEFRLPKSVLDDFEYRHLRLKDIKVRPNTDVGKALLLEDLFRDGYKAVFIGTGVWRPNTLHIKGESLGNVHYAINYLQNPDVYHLGRRLIVIGAGNAAMDVCRTALRHGTRHVECFSLSKKITASEYEASYAKLEGVNFHFNKKPVEITDKGVVFRDLNEAEDGTLTDIPGTEELYPSDSVIVSISQGPGTTITESEHDLKTNERGLFVTDELGHTSMPGVFASGDAVKGARTVVEAVAYSKKVAEAMHEYMQTLPPDLPDEYANVPVATYDDGNKTCFWAPSGRVTPHGVGRCRAATEGSGRVSGPAQAGGERAIRKGNMLRIMASLSPAGASRHLPRRGRFFYFALFCHNFETSTCYGKEKEAMLHEISFCIIICCFYSLYFIRLRRRQ